MKHIMPARRRGTAHGLTQTLGWFSIALGAAELLMPRVAARGAGLSGGGGSRFSIVGKGVRETALGIGLLTARDPTPWLWGRVGGDALDLGTTAFALLAGRRGGRALAAMLAVGGITVLDVACAQTLTAVRERQTRARPDYSNRSGFPKGLPQTRGAAREFAASHP